MRCVIAALLAGILLAWGCSKHPISSQRYEGSGSAPAPQPRASQDRPVRETSLSEPPRSAAARPVPPARPYANSVPATPAQAPAMVQEALYGQNVLAEFQVGSFSSYANAETLSSKLSGQGFQTQVVERVVGGATYYRVIASRAGSVEEVEAALSAAGIQAPIFQSRGGRPAGAPAPAAPSYDFAPAPPAPSYSPAPAAPAYGPGSQAAPPAAPVLSAPAPRSAAAAGPAGPRDVQAAADRSSQAADYPDVCTVSNTHIEAVGVASQGESDFMIQKAALQQAKRNLLLCIQAYKEKWASLPKHNSIEAVLPDRLVRFSPPLRRPDGSVEVRADIAILDANKIKITPVD